jgi:drug/metabolite transporter (DMT)-like permease
MALERPNEQSKDDRQTIRILWVVFIVDALVAVGAPFFDPWYLRYAFAKSPPKTDLPLSAGAALIAIVTFLGVWTIQSRRTKVNNLHHEMRDAITAAFIVVYLVILSWASFFPFTRSSGSTLNPLTSTLITNFTAATGIVIGFYFTTTSATQIAAQRKKQQDGEPDTATDKDNGKGD